MNWLGLPALRALAEGPLLTGELAKALGLATDKAGQVCRCLRARGLVRTYERIHELTAAGRQAVKRGEEITCGPAKGAVRRGESLRARAWRAMRIKEKFSLDDLLTLLCDGTEKAAESNLKDFLRVLERAGYLMELKRRGGDGSRRWWLAKDTGLQAPSWNRLTRTLADPNTGEVYRVASLADGRTNNAGAKE